METSGIVKTWTPSALPRYEHDTQVTEWIFGEQQIFGIERQVTDCSDNMKVLLNKTSDLVDDARKHLQDITDDISSVTTQFNGTGLAVEDTVERIKPIIDNLTTITDSVRHTATEGKTFLNRIKENAHMIGFNLFSLSRARSIPDILGPGLNLISNLGFDKILIDRLTEWLAAPKFTEQAFEETQQLLLMALTTFSTFSPVNFLSKMNFSKNLKEAEALQKIFEKFANVLNEWGFNISSKAKTLDLLRKTMVTAINELPQYEFDIIHNQPKFLNSCYRRKLDELKTQIDELRKDVSSHSYTDLRNSSFNAELMEVYRRIKTIVARSDMILKQASSRVRPVAYLFVGNSQIGKSELVLEIVNRIKHTVRKDELAEEMEFWTTWNHTATDAYHEGYIGQEIHVVDDIFSRTDHIDHADFINFISSNPFLTRQAALGDKGLPYTAKLVFASVNELPKSSNAIENFSALRNRFQIIHCDGPKPGLSDKIDKTFSHLQLTISDWDIFDNKSIHSRLPTNTVDELVDMIIDDAVKAESYYQSKMEPQGPPPQEARQSSSDPASLLKHNLKEQKVTMSGLLEDDSDDEDIVVEAREEVSFFDCCFTSGNIYSQHLAGFLKELKKDNRDLYMALRRARVKLGDREIRAVDYIEQLRIEQTYDFLWKLQQSGTLPQAKLFFNYGNYVYIWDDQEIVKTWRKSKEIADDRKFDVDFKQSWTDILKTAITQLQERIWPRFTKLFMGIKIAACATSLPYTIVSVICATFSVFFAQKERARQYDLQERLERGETITEEEALDPKGFWWRALSWSADAVSVGLAIFFLGWFIYKFYNVLTTMNTTTYCKDCQIYMDEESNKTDTLETMCKLTCVDGHLAECNYRKASLRRDCSACQKKLCQGTCYHNMYIHQSLLDASYLRIAAIEGHLEASSDSKRLRTNTYKRVNMESKQKKQKIPTEPQHIHEEINLVEIQSPHQVIKQEEIVEEVSPAGKVMRVKEYIRPIHANVELIQGYSSHGKAVGSNDTPLKLVRASLEQEELPEVLHAKTESCLDEQAKNILASLVNLTVKIVRRHKFGQAREAFLHGLGIGNYIICPQHIHVHGSKDYEYFMIRDNDEFPLTFEKENVNMDLACFSFDIRTTSPFKRTILKHLMTNSEYNKVMVKRWPGFQFIPGHARYGLIQNIVIDYKLSRTRFRLTNGNSKVMDNTLEITATQTCSPATSAGDCGGFIVVENPNISRKLVGMHVVGSEKAAYSAILTSDLVQSLFPKHQLESGEGPLLSVINTSVGPVYDILNLVEWEDTFQTYMPEGDFEYLGDISYLKPQNVTELREHPFKDLFECRVAPAALHHSQIAEEHLSKVPLNKKGIPDLLLMKAEKYGKLPPNLSEKHINIIHQLKETVVERFVTVMQGQDIGPCDWDEAVGGDPLDVFSHALKGSTSAGIGWNRSQHGAPLKKSSYFTTTVPQKLDTSTQHGKKLMDTLILTENLMKNGHRTLSIDKNCLKDEIRPLEKTWKPRLFKARPLDKVILKRKYFLRFKMAWTKANLLLHHAVGINPISTQWAELYFYLIGLSNEGFDADFGGFDTNQLKIFQELWRDVKIDVIKTVQQQNGKPLTQGEINIMEVLLNENIDSISSCYSNVYMDHHGNSSGDPDTTEDNSAINLLYHFFAFVLIMAKNKYGSDYSFEQACEFIDFELFRRHVRAVFFGDDLCILPDPEIGYTFNAVQDIMVNILEQDYTSASKDKNSCEKDICELSFLKRKFKVAGPTFITAPLEKDSIESRFCYTMIHPADLEAHSTLVYEGLLEASCYGPIYYNELREKLKRGISRSKWHNHPSFEGKTLAYSSMRGDYAMRYNEGGF